MCDNVASFLLQLDLMHRAVKCLEDKEFITDTLSHGDSKFMVCLQLTNSHL